jgi:hypothetical protein
MAGSNRRRVSQDARHRAWLRARSRAASIDHLIIPFVGFEGDWMVTASNLEGGYIVGRTSPNCFSYVCNCPAGIRGNVCWHAAAVACLPAEANKRRIRREQLAQEARESLQRLLRGEEYGMEYIATQRSGYNYYPEGPHPDYRDSDPYTENPNVFNLDELES